MPQLNYDHAALRLGMITSSLLEETESYLNPDLPQVGTVTYGGGASGSAGTEVQFDGEEGTYGVVVDFSGAASATAGGVLLLAALEAEPILASLFDFVVALGVVTYTAKATGKDYVVSFPVNPNTDMTTAVTQASGGTTVPLGVGVVPASGGPSVNCEHAAQPGGSAADADFLGITCSRATQTELNDVTRPNEAAHGGRPGEVMAVLKKGEMAVMVEDAVAFNGPVFMRIASGSTTNPLGGFRSDADGGDAIAITGAKFRSVTTGRGLVKIKVDRL